MTVTAMWWQPISTNHPWYASQNGWLPSNYPLETSPFGKATINLMGTSMSIHVNQPNSGGHHQCWWVYKSNQIHNLCSSLLQIITKCLSSIISRLPSITSHLSRVLFINLQPPIYQTTWPISSESLVMIMNDIPRAGFVVATVTLWSDTDSSIKENSND